MTFRDKTETRGEIVINRAGARGSSPSAPTSGGSVTEETADRIATAQTALTEILSVIDRNTDAAAAVVVATDGVSRAIGTLDITVDRVCRGVR